MASVRGIALSKVSPAFLHANSTSHTWVFSAFAEIIDNAYDPDVSASELLIDKIDINGVPCLIFLDNGAGMDTDHLLKMLSFGYCEKAVYEKQGSHQPIGHYGNGFKSGSMRIGQDALVFTRCHKSASIGFLSQTYLAAVHTDSVVVPILEYRLPSLERIKSQESRNNLNAILQFSVFKMEDELKEELKALEGSKTGTKIIISNLKRFQDRNYELDFSSDPSDIRCPEAHEVDATSVYHRPIQQSFSEYKRSLREYCSILFLRPRMKITIRGSRVKSKLISKSLSNTEIDMYKPTWLSRPVKIIFGFKCEKKAEDYDYGMMLYHRNRLIKAFEKVGYQKQPNGLGIGVVGVAQVDFLQPIHNKQDFNKDEKFNSVMAAFSNKLNDYWNEKKGSNSLSSIQSVRNLPDWLWAQCDQCLKWRRLLDEIDPESLPDFWYCRMNPDATHNRCDIPEEPEDEDLAVKPTYEKTFKKKQEERKRLQQIEREKEDEAKRRKIMEKERELKQKEATLRAIQQVASAQPNIQDNRTVTSLQKALAEVRRKEDQQKRLILQIQEQKKLMEEQRNSLLQMAENLQTADKDQSKNVLKQMSKLIGTFSSQSISSPSTLANKRKFSEETPTTPNAKHKKKICIKTETGEMLSITQNVFDSDDNEEIDTNHKTSPATQKKQSNGNASQVKTEPGKHTHAGSPSKASKANPITLNNAKNDSTNSDTKPMPTAEQLSQRVETTTEHANQASSPTKPRRKHHNGTVMAVIDLTSESEFGEMVDIKPHLDELHTAVQANLQHGEDMKPDKTVLDEVMKLDKTVDEVISKTDDSNKQKATVTPLDETKLEIVETCVPSSNANTSPKKASTSEEINVKEDDKISFGPSEDDPEFTMDIPEHFQENLEAAMAAIQERMEREKLEHEGNHSLTEANLSLDDSKVKLKTMATIASPKQLIDSASCLEELPEDVRTGDAETGMEDEERLENDDTSTDFTFKDVMITSGDDNSDFDGPEEDDSDYRDYSGLYEKADLNEPHIDSKQYDSMGGSRNNSVEEESGSSSQGTSDDGRSIVQQESVESPNGHLIMVDKLAIAKGLFNEQQHINFSGSNVECQLQNRLEEDSPAGSTTVGGNIEFSCLNSLTNISDSPSNLASGQDQVAETQTGKEGSHSSIVRLVLNGCESCSEPLVQDVQASEQQSADTAMTECPPSDPVTDHEHLVSPVDNVFPREDSISSEQIMHEIVYSVDNEQNFGENDASVDIKEILRESEDVVTNFISDHASVAVNLRNMSSCQRFSIKNYQKAPGISDPTLLPSLPYDEANLEPFITMADRVQDNVITDEVSSNDATNVTADAVSNKDATNVMADEVSSKDSTNVTTDEVSNKDATNVTADEVSSKDSTNVTADEVSSKDSTNVMTDAVSSKDATNVMTDEVSNKDAICNKDATNVTTDEVSNKDAISNKDATNVMTDEVSNKDAISNKNATNMTTDEITNKDATNVMTDEVSNKDATAELQCKHQLQAISSESLSDATLGKCSLSTACHQLMQTDLDMAAVSDILRQYADASVGLMCRPNGSYFKHKQSLAHVVTADKSSQTLDCEQALSSVESQTKEIEWKAGSTDKETRERLETELLVKSQRFEEVEQKLSEINGNIYKLLGFISPETQLGKVNNIDQIIRDMITAHVEPATRIS